MLTKGTGCKMSRVIVQAESRERNSPHGTKGSARSIRSLDTAVLMTETDWRPKSRTACETWRSEATADTGLLLRDPETFVSDGYSHTKPRYAEALDSLKVGEANKKETNLCRSSTVTSEPSDERDYFQTPVSSYTRPVFGVGFGTDRSDFSELDNRVQRRSTAFEIDDFVNSSGSTTLRDLSPRSNASLDTKVLLRDPDENSDYRTQTGHYRLDSDQHFSDYSSELDEDDSSEDTLDDLVSARTFASLTTEVLLKPTEELAKVLGSHKARKTGRPPKETHRRVTSSLQETSNLTECELSSTRAINHGIKSENSSTLSDKPAASQHSKTKPPASKSSYKNYDIPSSRLSSQKCFSDLGMVDHDEDSSETASTLVSNGEGMSRRGTRNNVEHARMHRSFAQRFAQHDNNTPQSNLRQRSTFNQIQRSKSASRSGITGPSSVLDSPRSVETGVSLGQRIVRKSQENKKKMRQTTAAANNALPQSFMRDDESSSVSLQNSTLSFHDQSAKRSMKKKNRNHTLNRVQEDILDDALGLTVKGNPVQSRPVSSSLSLQEVAANEWIRRKKYNPRQSLQTEASLKKTGKREGKPTQRSGNIKQSEPGQRNSNNFADSSAKNAPSTSSDWTDDEEQQIPCGRDLSAVCQVSARVKRLSGQVLQALRKRPEFEVNEMFLLNSKQKLSDADCLENSSPEFLYIIQNLEAAEQQMSAVFKALSSER